MNCLRFPRLVFMVSWTSKASIGHRGWYMVRDYSVLSSNVRYINRNYSTVELSTINLEPFIRVFQIKITLHQGIYDRDKRVFFILCVHWIGIYLKSGIRNFFPIPRRKCTEKDKNCPAIKSFIRKVSSSLC